MHLNRNQNLTEGKEGWGSCPISLAIRLSKKKSKATLDTWERSPHEMLYPAQAKEKVEYFSFQCTDALVMLTWTSLVGCTHFSFLMSSSISRLIEEDATAPST